jgi:hypothetical protein
MILSIHQPLYFPWTGYFHKMAVSDAHVVLDDVEFDDESFVKRNKIRTTDGWTWLTVPVHASNDTLIRDVQIAQEHRWASKHWKTLQTYYTRAPHFDDHETFFEEVYDQDWEYLNDLNLEVVEYVRDQLGIDTPMTASSELEADGAKSDLILSICQGMDADVYLSGPNGRDYLDTESFEDAGIAIAYHDFDHPTYSQAFDGFESHMSAVDLLFNHGSDSREIIMNENRSTLTEEAVR